MSMVLSELVGCCGVDEEVVAVGSGAAMTETMSRCAVARDWRCCRRIPIWDATTQLQHPGES